eukprot:CAMPEP_0194220414 /NCGR_PEP_ID=MMETSP0156-20130528/28296_1 /TAXON_ID=33649 /ORGANISM="Thalassionema nitzschioides, Strain L26-B" /LENGTH=103 /DNA_ID=CAMNT_0038950435 /DNA_START=44 /DNA_END=356 /DNA_ORIENTATION=+
MKVDNRKGHQLVQNEDGDGKFSIHDGDIEIIWNCYNNNDSHVCQCHVRTFQFLLGPKPAKSASFSGHIMMAQSCRNTGSLPSHPVANSIFSLYLVESEEDDDH